MMALEWGVERPAGTEIKTLTDGCVTTHQFCFPAKCLLTTTKSYAHSMSVRHRMRCMTSGLRDCLEFIMWTTAILSERALTVFPAHEWPHSAAAKTIGISYWTVMWAEEPVPLHCS